MNIFRTFQTATGVVIDMWSAQQKVGVQVTCCFMLRL